MSYEIERIEEIRCLCGNGKIQRIVKSNDWNQTKEYIEFTCDKCKKKYEIITEILCTKPKHEHIIYYCRNKEDGEKFKLDL